MSQYKMSHSLRDTRLMNFDITNATFTQGKYRVSMPLSVFDGRKIEKIKSEQIVYQNFRNIKPLTPNYVTLSSINDSFYLVNISTGLKLRASVGNLTFPQASNQAFANTIAGAMNALAPALGLSATFTVTANAVVVNVSYTYTIANANSDFGLDFYLPVSSIGPILGFGYVTLYSGANNPRSYTSLYNGPVVTGMLASTYEPRYYVMSNLVSGIDHGILVLNGTSGIPNVIASYPPPVSGNTPVPQFFTFSQTTPYVICEGSDVNRQIQLGNDPITIDFWIRPSRGFAFQDNLQTDFFSFQASIELQQNTDVISKLS